MLLSYLYCGILQALSVKLHKNIKILTHTSLITQTSDIIFSSLSFSHAVSQEGTITSASGQSVSQSDGGHIS